ncbi:MAG: zinc ribbon domain-containing protein [Pseudomonadota bacterium]|nr:zinc ribbon domain-containing protein [Pseudomonadota bacterium]MDQ3228207.1 zinc ribbon domain-containing protein [Pseudomonadota bacterium]
MTSFACGKCGGTEYSRKEMRAEGGVLSAAFDIATNRFTAVSCEKCGFTELYRTGTSAGSKIFDFLVS